MGREGGGGGGGGGWWCAGGVLVVCWWCAGGMGLKNLVSINKLTKNKKCDYGNPVSPPAAKFP